MDYWLFDNGLVWLIGVGVCLHCAPQDHLFACAGNGSLHDALAHVNQLPLPKL